MVAFKDRILYFDELRALAIIFILFWHTSNNFVTSPANWNVVISVLSLVICGIPLFLMISGALILNKKKYTLTEFFTKRFKRIFIPFIFWVVIFFILGLFVFSDAYGLSNYDTAASLSIPYLGSVFFSLSLFSKLFWFIWFIIGFYLIAPVLDSFIKDRGFEGLEYLLILIIICSIIPTLGWENAGISDRLKYFVPFIYTISYPVLGYYLHNKEFNLSDKYLFLIGIVLTVVGYIFSFLTMHSLGAGDLSLNYLHFNHFAILMEVTGIFLIFKYANVKMISAKLKPLKETFLAKPIVSLSVCSFGIFFVHWPLLHYLISRKFFLQFAIGKAYIWIFVFGVILVILSWIIVLIMSKIPILKWGSGVK